MTQNNGIIIVVDDDMDMREVVVEYLTEENYTVEAYPSAIELLAHRSQPSDLSDVDAILSDLRMPEMSGIQLIERMQLIEKDLPVILMTAFGSIESALEATRKGAYDYVVKPLRLSELGAKIERAIHYRNLKRENSALREQIQTNWAFENLIGKSRGMQEVFSVVDRVAKSMANILISGESGTGKEMIAKAIHSRSSRASGPFIAINCSSIPENLLESELFGHIKGSFTGAAQNKTGLFEEANGGTLFLDEIGDMNISLQAKVLRVLQERKIKPVGQTTEKPIDVRIVAATHKDLKSAIQKGDFREDLFYRLSVIPLTIPPLRQRKEDIPLLANYFLRKYSAINGVDIKGFTAEAIQRLMSCRWPGNVRELENMIERLVVLANSSWIEADTIPKASEIDTEDFFTEAATALPSLEEFERKYIRFVLQHTGGHKNKAAEILGVNRRTIYRKEKSGEPLQ